MGLIEIRNSGVVLSAALSLVACQGGLGGGSAESSATGAIAPGSVLPPNNGTGQVVVSGLKAAVAYRCPPLNFRQSFGAPWSSTPEPTDCDDAYVDGILNLAGQTIEAAAVAAVVGQGFELSPNAKTTLLRTVTAELKAQIQKTSSWTSTCTAAQGQPAPKGETIYKYCGSDGFGDVPSIDVPDSVTVKFIPKAKDFSPTAGLKISANFCPNPEEVKAIAASGTKGTTAGIAGTDSAAYDAWFYTANREAMLSAVRAAGITLIEPPAGTTGGTSIDDDLKAYFPLKKPSAPGELSLAYTCGVAGIRGFLQASRDAEYQVAKAAKAQGAAAGTPPLTPDEHFDGMFLVRLGK